jgi:hypothetical protein
MIPQGNQNDSEGLSKRLETKENTPVNNPINKENKRKRFTPPTLEEAIAYCNNQLEAEKFILHYESNGWKVGKNKMVNWKSALTGWLKRSAEFQINQQRPNYVNDEVNW